jgi:hypothetical protein
VGVGHERLRTFKLNPLSAVDATGLMNGQRVMYFSTHVEWVDDAGKKGSETTCQWLDTPKAPILKTGELLWNMCKKRRAEVPSKGSAGEPAPLFDVFVSHATEDKTYVAPLVEAIKDAGICVWFDQTSLEWGDDLRAAIDRGLTNCRFGIVVFSKAFLRKKKWTEYELNSLFAREQAGKKLVLPIWHGVTRDDLVEYSPAFADRLAKISSTDSYRDIVQSLISMLGVAKLAQSSEPSATDAHATRAVDDKP